jgi:splicing factor U2AF subunit
MTEDKVKLVVGPDGRPTGEAYVEISGPGARLRLALAKDRHVMPGSSRYVEIFTSTRDEVDRRLLTGVMLV